jgi:hypothetical protein
MFDVLQDAFYNKWMVLIENFHAGWQPTLARAMSSIGHFLYWANHSLKCGTSRTNLFSSKQTAFIFGVLNSCLQLTARLFSRSN